MHENHPKLVVMYGTALKHQMQSWEATAGSRLLLDNILISDGTKLVVTPHPQKRGLDDAYWKELEERLRNVYRKKSG